MHYIDVASTRNVNFGFTKTYATKEPAMKVYDFPTNPEALTEPYWNPSARTVSKAELQKFCDRLYSKMVERGWTQADLARAAFGTDEKGRVIDREKVSLWLRSGGLPGEDKMRKLAFVLNMSLKDLAPQIDKSPLERSRTASQSPPRNLRLRRPVPMNEWANVQLQPGGKVILQLTLDNELAQAVMEFAQKRMETA